MDGTQPQKFDAEKPRTDLLPTDALEEISKVLGFGVVKYAAGNWATGSGFAWCRLYGAILRHLFAWARGQDRDPETGLSHVAHAGCMVLFLLAHILRRHGTDDRTTNGLRHEPRTASRDRYEMYEDEDAEGMMGARAL